MPRTIRWEYMLTFRYLMAVGGAFAISFAGGLCPIASCLIEPGFSQIPSPTQQASDPTVQPGNIVEPPPDKPKPEISSPTPSPKLDLAAGETRSPAPTPGSVPNSGVENLNPQPSAPTQSPPAPDFLNPSANPLLFPTNSEEVKIQTTQPITLQQAIELARRNNRQLQVGRQTLERSQAALQEALAAQFPTIDLNLNFTRSQNSSTRIGNTTIGNTTTGNTTTGNTTTGNTTTGNTTTGNTTTGNTTTGNTTTGNTTTGNTTTGNTTTGNTTTGNTTTGNTTTGNTTTGNTTTVVGDTGDAISTTFSGSIEVNYDIYTAGRRPAQIQAAREQVRLDELDVERLLEQLRLDVTNDYYDLQEADAQVRISQASVNESARSLRDALLLEQAGLGTRFDVLRAQVTLANSNQDLINSIAQQQVNRRQIVQRLSLAQPVDVVAADPIAPAGSWELSLEQSIVLAYKNRVELEQQLVQRSISEQQIRVALAANRPQASLFSSYEISGVVDDDAGASDGFTLGARLRWNLYDGGAARAQVAQQRANIAIAETNFADQRNQIRFAVEQSYINLRANGRNIETATLAVTQAQESLRLARLRFQAGVGTQTDVLTSQTELTRAQVNLLTAILNYNRSLATLQRSVSNLPDSGLFDTP